MAIRNTDEGNPARMADETQDAPTREEIAALVRMLERVDRDSIAGHDRLRKDVTALELLMTQATAERVAIRLELTRLAATPLEAGRLVAAPRTVIGIVAIVISIIGSFSASTWMIRSAFTRLESRMETAEEIRNVKDTALRTAVEGMGRRIELQQYEIQQLKELVLSSSGTRRKTP